MKDPRKIVLVATIGILILLFGMAYLKEQLSKRSPTILPTETVMPTKVVDPYQDWTLFRNGYAFPLPPEWKNSSDVGGVAVLEPTDPAVNTLKNIQKISAIILSDKKATGQRFTTEKEFIEWMAVAGAVQGSVQKLENSIIDGEKAIMLIQRAESADTWKIIVWTRKDGVNVYLNFDGVGTYEGAEMQAIKYIIAHFTFTPPPTTGKKE